MAPPAEPENTQELGATMVSGGVQISKTRGLTVDGEQHGAIKRDDLRFEPGALGAGACSVVRLARHTATNQRYAVKLFAIFDDAKRRQLVRRSVHYLVWTARRSCSSTVLIWMVVQARS